MLNVSSNLIYLLNNNQEIFLNNSFQNDNKNFFEKNNKNEINSSQGSFLKKLLLVGTTATITNCVHWLRGVDIFDFCKRPTIHQCFKWCFVDWRLWDKAGILPRDICIPYLESIEALRILFNGVDQCLLF